MKKRRFWRLGIESAETYLSVFCGLFTLQFCRCGECFLPLILSNIKEEPARTCGFCFKKFTYDEMPDDSICFLGIFACAKCLEKEETKDFRELVETIESGGGLSLTKLTFQKVRETL